MEEKNKLIFDAYRYQLLPKSKNIQLRVDEADLTYKKLVERKNRFFEEIIISKSLNFKRGNSQIVHETRKVEKNNFAIRFGLQKRDIIEKEDFTKEEIKRYPDFYVLIDNKKNTQLMLIQRNYKAVDKTETISRILERNLTKQQMAKLTDCAYLSRGENIIITGATGCGKSYLACALGHQACLYGHRTLYFNMNRFCEQIAIAKVDGTLIKWMNRIKKAKLLIMDDFGLQQMSHDVKLSLLQIFEDRYKESSTIITSQLPLSKWHAYINEPTVADAILDRLTAKYSKIELKGKSLRKST